MVKWEKITYLPVRLISDNIPEGGSEVTIFHIRTTCIIIGARFKMIPLRLRFERQSAVSEVNGFFLLSKVLSNKKLLEIWKTKLSVEFYPVR